MEQPQKGDVKSCSKINVSVHSTLLILLHFTFLQVPNGIDKERVYYGRHL